MNIKGKYLEGWSPSCTQIEKYKCNPFQVTVGVESGLAALQLIKSRGRAPGGTTAEARGPF